MGIKYPYFMERFNNFAFSLNPKIIFNYTSVESVEKQEDVDKNVMKIIYSPYVTSRKRNEIMITVLNDNNVFQITIEYDNAYYYDEEIEYFTKLIKKNLNLIINNPLDKLML
jgi:hypothetical protein